VTLCDFGLCSKFDQSIELSEFVGSAGFFDPDMIINGCYSAEKCDIFSSGAVILEMVLGHNLFYDFWMVAYDFEVMKDKQHFAEAIYRVVGTITARFTGRLSDELVDFLTKVLEVDSRQRITVAEALRHPWLASEAEAAAQAASPSPPRALPQCVSNMNLEDLAIADYEGKLNSYESALRR